MIYIDIPATTSLSQPPNAWLFIGIFGIIPPVIFVGGVLVGLSKAGVAGGGGYVLMTLVSSQIFNNPGLSVFMLIGIVVTLFLYLAVKLMRHRRQRNRGPRRGLYR